MDILTESQAFKNIFKTFSDEIQVCIQSCNLASQACEQLIQHCLKKGESHADPDHIGLLEDCVDICNLTSRYMVRESSLHNRACEFCAEVCLACAMDCERFEDDDVMRSCAEICRKCSECCSTLAGSFH